MEIPIDDALVRELVAAQFPRWADLPVRSVARGGHDNRTFHLGGGMSARLPSAERYAAHVAIEHEWLPKIGRQLPLPIPELLGKGAPGAGYPWPWTVNRWLRGESADRGHIADEVQFARDLAHFLNALQAADATGAPAPGRHNFHRGGALAVYDGQTRECLGALRGEIDVAAATAIWEEALAAEWGRPPVWVHGDVAAGNLLVDGGRLCAVIDFGQLAAGDPACDLAIAWAFFSGASREAFRAELAVDAATWARGKGWWLWKALLNLRQRRPDAASQMRGLLVA